MAENETVKVVQLSINPQYLAMVPRPSPEEYAALKADIQLHGIEKNLDINQDGVVLDGHTRFRIAQELGLETVPITVREFQDPHEEELAVIRWNLKRRQLNSAQKIELIMVLEAKLAEENRRIQEASRCPKGVKIGDHVKAGQELALPKQGRSAEVAANEYGLSRETYRKGKKIVIAAQENPEIAEAWKEAKIGKRSIDSVYRQVKYGTSQPEEEPHVVNYKRFTTLFAQIIGLDVDKMLEWPVDYQTKALHQIQQMRMHLRAVENTLTG